MPSITCPCRRNRCLARQQQRLGGVEGGVEVSLPNDACPWSGGAERAAWAGASSGANRPRHPRAGERLLFEKGDLYIYIYIHTYIHIFPHHHPVLFATVATARTSLLGRDPVEIPIGCLDDIQHFPSARLLTLHRNPPGLRRVRSCSHAPRSCVAQGGSRSEKERGLHLPG